MTQKKEEPQIKNEPVVMNETTSYTKKMLLMEFIPPLSEGEHPIFSMVITNLGYRFGFNTKCNNFATSTAILGNLEIVKSLIHDNIVSNVKPRPQEEDDLDYIG